MYSYIGKSEITELIQNYRKGIIIEDVVTNDIDEYINSLFAILRNNGMNTNIFTQAKIKKITNTGSVNHRYKYIILLTIRKDSKISIKEYENIEKCIQNMVPCKTIQEWMKTKYLR